jgi:hypothetical protein
MTRAEDVCWSTPSKLRHIICRWNAMYIVQSCSETAWSCKLCTFDMFL